MQLVNQLVTSVASLRGIDSVVFATHQQMAALPAWRLHAEQTNINASWVAFDSRMYFYDFVVKYKYVKTLDVRNAHLLF